MQRDDAGEFLNFLKLWESRYEYFIMDRGIYFDE